MNELILPWPDRALHPKELGISAIRLKELVSYSPDSGVFTWIAIRQGVKRGSVAGSVTNKGYVAIRVDGNLFMAHRLAWLYVHDRWPRDQIDHINGKRSDNRIANLRECLSAENQQNMKRRSDNSSGLTNVCWHSQAGKWRSYITVGGVQRSLGLYTDRADAYRAFERAKRELHSFNPRVRPE